MIVGKFKLTLLKETNDISKVNKELAGIENGTLKLGENNGKKIISFISFRPKSIGILGYL